MLLAPLLRSNRAANNRISTHPLDSGWKAEGERVHFCPGLPLAETFHTLSSWPIFQSSSAFCSAPTSGALYSPPDKGSWDSGPVSVCAHQPFLKMFCCVFAVWRKTDEDKRTVLIYCNLLQGSINERRARRDGVRMSPFDSPRESAFPFGRRELAMSGALSS